MIVVADTSPLQVEILPRLFQQVVIERAAWMDRDSIL